MPGIDGENPTDEQLECIRSAVKDYINENGNDVFHPADVKRLMAEDAYGQRFYKHVFETTGDQLETAIKMTIKTFTWRKEFGVREITEETLSEVLKSKGSLYVHNRDKDGKRMVIFQVRKHQKGVEPMEDLKKFFVYFMDRIDREDNGDEMTLVFDCASCGLKNMDMEFIQYMIGVLKDYYPRCLNYILVYEMPWVLSAAWKIIKSWLPASAVKKIKFVSKSNIGEYVPEDQRLISWGGTDDWEYEFVSEKPLANGNNSDTTSISSDEGNKKKSVSFVGGLNPNLINNDAELSPIDEGLNIDDSMPSSSSSVSNDNNNNIKEATGGLLSLNPSDEIMFSPGSQGELLGKVVVTNKSDKPIIYKIKTTSPDKYRVRPSMANIGPGESSQIEIHVSANQIVVVKDKFLITAVNVEKTGISHQQLSEIMKASTPDDQYRLRCALDSSLMTTTFGTTAKPTNQIADVSSTSTKTIENMNKKVSKLTQDTEELVNTVQSLKTLVYILLVLCLSLIIFNLWDMTRSNPSICIFPDTNDSLSPSSSINAPQTEL